MNKKNTGFQTVWVSYTVATIFFQIKSLFPKARVNNGQWYLTNFDRPTHIERHDGDLSQPEGESSIQFYACQRPAAPPFGRYPLFEPVVLDADLLVYLDRNQGFTLRPRPRKFRFLPRYPLL